MIPVTNRQRRVAVGARDVRRVVEATFAHEGAGEPDVGVVLLGDAAIRRINREWHDDDRPTDSLAFSYEDDPSPDGLRGEVVVSAETARREAEARGTDAVHELLLYVVHGTLHLLGHDDDTPARRRAMNARADRILASVGVRARR